MQRLADHFLLTLLAFGKGTSEDEIKKGGKKYITVCMFTYGQLRICKLHFKRGFENPLTNIN